MAKDNGRRDFRGVAGLDPAANWVLGAGRGDYLPDPETPIPFLLELFDAGAVDAFREPWPLDESRRNGLVVVGFGEKDDIVAGEPALVFASLGWFERLLDGSERSNAFVRAAKSMVLGSPGVPKGGTGSKMASDGLPPGRLTLASDMVKPPEGGFPSGTVIMAVIDDGIAFAHERLRLLDPATQKPTSRVHAFWNMNHFDPLQVPLLGIPGELGKAEIDALLAAHAPGGIVDEDAVYAAAKLIDASDPRQKSAAWRVAHGAHVLDLAAGYDIDENVLNRPVIAVQLPTPVVAQTTGEMLDAAVWLAIGFVLYSARRLAGAGDEIPVVINVSFGKLASAHDGNGPLERAMNSVIGPNVQIVLPAGNAQLSRCHAEVRFPEESDAAVEFELIVQPNDRTHSVVEVWLPPAKNPGNRMTLTVRRPDGVPHQIEEIPGAWEPINDAAGRPMGEIELISIEDQQLFRMTLMPTDRPQPTEDPVALSGSWLLKFARGLEEMKGVAHVWVQRDDSLHGYPQSGRQSYFDHDAYARYTETGFEVTDDPASPPCPVTRRSLFNGIATGSRAITAGGYRERECGVARYSAGGPNVPPEVGPPDRRKPDALLPSEGSKPHRGVLAAGSRSGARVALSGTSVAAPQLARLVAREDGTLADREAVAAMARASGICLPRDPADPPDPVDRVGHGRLARAGRRLAERFER